MQVKTTASIMYQRRNSLEIHKLFNVFKNIANQTLSLMIEHINNFEKGPVEQRNLFKPDELSNIHVLKCF